jgi:hypothetical protein
MKCPKCGCKEYTIKETYGPMSPIQEWYVCEACDQIIGKVESKKQP